MEGLDKVKEHISRAADYIAGKKFDQVIEELTIATRKLNFDNPDEVIKHKDLAVMIMATLGMAHKGKCNYDQAIECFTVSANLNGNRMSVMERAKTYALKGDINKAINDFELLLKVHPNDTETRQLLDMCKKERGW